MNLFIYCVAQEVFLLDLFYTALSLINSDFHFAHSVEIVFYNLCSIPLSIMCIDVLIIIDTEFACLYLERILFLHQFQQRAFLDIPSSRLYSSPEIRFSTFPQLNKN